MLFSARASTTIAAAPLGPGTSDHAVESHPVVAQVRSQDVRRRVGADSGDQVDLAPALAAATAWLPPLPPGAADDADASTVSPGRGSDCTRERLIEVDAAHHAHPRRHSLDRMEPHARAPQSPGHIGDDVLDDLRRRLVATNRVRLPEGTEWSRGTDASHLTDLIDYWSSDYDWRPHEERILSLPWETVTVGDTSVRALHQRSRGATDTVMLVHGWPDSVLRFERVLPLLTDVNVVVPASRAFRSLRR